MTEQGTPEWHAIRCGRVTASKIADMLARTKTAWGASRANYRAQLVAERLTGVVAETFTSAAMEWGTAMEGEARSCYALLRGLEVEAIDFAIHPAIPMSGASPDGLVGPDGLVEIKCPNTATHIETLLGGSVPGKYRHQMLWQMACTGRKWCDFVSYDQRMPEDMRMFVRRLHRDDAEIAATEAEVRTFLAEIEATVVQLTALYRTQQATE